ncbi:MAG: peptidoglycan-binding domain-containing protein [Chthoniobacterales bacterium]
MPENGLVFFGFRGCLPLDPEDVSFAPSRSLKTAEVNYLNPRCTLGQWMPERRTLAVFPGSTCPNQALVISAKGKGGAGVNQLLTGYYSFVKGMHHADKRSGHQAFRQEEERVVLRNTDDLDFDFHDRLERGVQFDNLHCGFSAGVNSGYSSAGCQVVVGFPTTNDHLRKESGPWAAFRQTAYNLDQARFRYILVHGSEVEAMAQDIDLARAATIRFGSHGELVRHVQSILHDLGLISFIPDADCGPQMQMAIIRFQIERMGAENSDGILGANTAAQLGITDWPTVGKNPPVALNGKPLVLDLGVGQGMQPQGAETFRFSGDYKLPSFAVAHFNAAAGVLWDGAQPVRDWNDYSGCVRNSGYAFPNAPVPALFTRRNLRSTRMASRRKRAAIRPGRTKRPCATKRASRSIPGNIPSSSCP